MVTDREQQEAIVCVHHLLKVRSTGCVLAVELNDVPIVTRLDGGKVQSIENVNSWIVPGRNTLRVRLASPLRGARLGPASSCRVQLERVGVGQGAGASLAGVAWPAWSEGTNAAAAAASPPEPEVAQGGAVVRTAEFEVADPPPSQLWEGAVAVRLSPETCEQVLGVVGRLHEALRGHDAARAGALLDFKATELARTQYLSPEEVRREQRQLLDMAARAPEQSWEPRREELHTRLRMRLVANGRLVWVTRSDGYGPALRSSTPGGSTVQIAMWLAPVKGEWMVVR